MMKNILLGLLLLAFISCSDDDDMSIVERDAMLIESLQGVWESNSLTEFPIEAPGSPIQIAYLEETFIFEGATNRLTTAAFADEALTIPILVYESVGPFTIIGQSTLFENTWEVDFANVEQKLTLLSSDTELLSVFGFESCGITEQNITFNINDGCGIFPSITECVEKDIIQVTNNTLRFGTRTEDICDVRVTTLQDVVYTKTM